MSMKAEIETGPLSAPICLTWQITDRCNLRCVHCLAASTDKKPGELDMSQIKLFLDDLAEMRVFYINVGGGEPLLHPHFFDIADYAGEKGVYIQFSTNGTLIDGTIAAEVAKRGLRVQVSLDGWEQAVNDPIRGVGTFHKVVRAIELLRKKNIRVSVNCVVTKSAVPGLDELYRLAASFDARLRLSRLRPSGRAGECWRDLAPSREQYFQLFQWLKRHPDVTTGDSFFFLSALGEPLPGLSQCGAGKLTCSVDSHGFVYPCPFTADPALAVGNIKEQPLSRLWQESGLFKQLRQQKPGSCTSCDSFGKCRGGCRGAAYLVYKDWSRSDPECMRRESDGAVSIQ